MTFFRVFAYISLILFGWMAFLSVLIMFMLFRFSLTETAGGPQLQQNFLLGAVSENMEVYLASLFIFSALAIVSSLALLKNRRWAYQAWIGLLGLLALWFFIGLAAEIHETVIQLSPGGGQSGLSEIQLFSLTIMGTIAGGGLLGIGLLLRRFLNETRSWRSDQRLETRS